MAPSFAQLDALVRLSNNKGIDIRPMLLRVLTDLYTQEHAHTRERQQQFCELALRLIPAVDVQTRAAIAGKLARYPQVPAAVLEHLAADLPDVAGALEPSARASEAGEAKLPSRSDDGKAADGVAPVDAPRQAYLATAGAITTEKPFAISPVLAEEFLAGDSAQREAILSTLEEALGRRGEGNPPRPVAKPGTLERLEKAALAGDAAEFARELHQSFALSRRLATRIAEDERGEALVVTAQAIGMPRAVLVRVLLFLNPSLGRSVERVFALVRFYETMSLGTATNLFASWRESGAARPSAAAHQGVHASGPAPALVGLMSNARRLVEGPADLPVHRRAGVPPRDRRQGTT